MGCQISNVLVCSQVFIVNNNLEVEMFSVKVKQKNNTKKRNTQNTVVINVVLSMFSILRQNLFIYFIVFLTGFGKKQGSIMNFDLDDIPPPPDHIPPPPPDVSTASHHGARNNGLVLPDKEGSSESMQSSGSENSDTVYVRVAIPEQNLHVSIVCV